MNDVKLEYMAEDSFPGGIWVREQRYRRYQQYEDYCYYDGSPSYQKGRLLPEKFPDLMASCLYVVHGLGLWLLVFGR